MSSHDSTLVINELFLNYYDLIYFSYGAIPSPRQNVSNPVQIHGLMFGRLSDSNC